MTINQEAPVVQSKNIHINAKPETIWKVLTDIEKWPKWNSKITDSTLKEEPNIGTSFTWKTNGSRIKSQIHTFDSDKAIGWIGQTFGAKAIHNWVLEPTKNGTKVAVKESMEGWFIFLLRKKMNNILEEDMQYWLEKLKIECEK